jgi:ADP-ribose pyrophosphatase
MPHDYQVLESARVFEGGVIAVRRDELSMPGDTTAARDVVEHPGSVAVVALDEDGAVVLVRQYRHPIGRELDELPAGILDKEGEPAAETAKRELAEEAGLGADEWHVLVDLLTSPGMSDEASRIFLARGLHEVDRDIQQHEEAEMTSFRVPLPELVDGILSGRYENSLLIAGVLAADHAARTGFDRLRPADAPWPSRPHAS